MCNIVPDDKSLGERIRESRKAKGLTQKQLAELLNITQGAVASLESGRSKPDLGTQKLLVKYLEFEPTFFTPQKKFNDSLGSKLSLGEIILDYRYKNFLTQQQFAEKIFVTRETISLIENNKILPNRSTLVLIAQVLQLEPHLLLEKFELEKKFRKLEPEEIKKNIPNLRLIQGRLDKVSFDNSIVNFEEFNQRKVFGGVYIACSANRNVMMSSSNTDSKEYKQWVFEKLISNSDSSVILKIDDESEQFCKMKIQVKKNYEGKEILVKNFKIIVKNKEYFITPEDGKKVLLSFELELKKEDSHDIKVFIGLPDKVETIEQETIQFLIIKEV